MGRLSPFVAGFCIVLSGFAGRLRVPDGVFAELAHLRAAPTSLRGADFESLRGALYQPWRPTRIFRMLPADL